MMCVTCVQYSEAEERRNPVYENCKPKLPLYFLLTGLTLLP